MNLLNAFILGFMTLAPLAHALPQPSKKAVEDYAPVYARKAAGERWVIYQRGPKVTFAIDKNSLAYGKDGLLYFTHEERFPQEMYDKPMNVRFYIRQTRVVADCVTDQFAFIRSDFLDKSRKMVFAGMFDLQKHQWNFIEVEADSIGEAMMTAGCALGKHPAYVK